MKAHQDTFSRERRAAKSLYGDLPRAAIFLLRQLVRQLGLSAESRDLIWLNQAWYVTHMGLLRLAQLRHCAGIHTQPVKNSCDPAASRWVFKATVFKSPKCKGFTGYGDADPCNVSTLVRGAEMRVAETRAVNRALRKAYGVGICSVEEIVSADATDAPERPLRKVGPESVSSTGHANVSGDNGNGSRLRDRLCQLIRQHSLDAELVKAYAVDFCGTKTLREATREQVENFIAHLADWAEKDRDALLCQLNSYSRWQAGAA